MHHIYTHSLIYVLANVHEFKNEQILRFWPGRQDGLNSQDIMIEKIEKTSIFVKVDK